jgi:hypothetical protein
MSETNLIHFGVDQQLASLRSKLLMSFGYQMHLCSSLSELETTVRRRRVQGCVICQTVPAKLITDAQVLLRDLNIPILVLTNGTHELAESPTLKYSSSSVRDFLPKIEAMMPRQA